MASLLFKDVAALWFLFLGMSRVKGCDICQVLGLIVARKFHWGCVCVCVLLWEVTCQDWNVGDKESGRGDSTR